MTSGGKLFFFILAFPFLVANTLPLEFSLVPKINCHDLNGNGFPDFIALSDSDLPRTIYHVELFSTKTEITGDMDKFLDSEKSRLSAFGEEYAEMEGIEAGI